MARKYYHVQGVHVVRNYHDGHGPGFECVANCYSEKAAGRIAAKLNAADDFEVALGVIAESRSPSAEYALRVLREANEKKPNHY